ncbi:MAG TPA: hypothetical protein VKB34_15050 [Povalibacter sp.]|nr:hypothetical protein [Povalibacter sp.]
MKGCAGRAAPRSRRTTRQLVLPLLAGWMTFALADLAGAVEDATLTLERVEGAGWSAQGVAVHLRLTRGAAVSATVERLTLPRQQELRNVRLECQALEMSTATISCPRARIVASLPAVGQQTLSGRISYGRTNGALDLQLDGLRVGEGSAGIVARLRDTGWQAQLTMDRINVEPLMQLAQRWRIPVAGLSATGALTGSLTASGAASAVQRVRIDARVSDLTANNPEGTLAADKLGLALQADLTQARGDWLFDATLSSRQGQAYAEPIFLDLGAHAMDLHARGTWRSDGVIEVDHFRLDHSDVAQGEGSATINPADKQPLRELRLNLAALKFPGAYASYFQPLLLDTNFKSLRTSGQIDGELVIANGAPQRIDLRLAGVSLDDGNRNFTLNGLGGAWHWTAAQTVTRQSEDEEDAREPTVVADSFLHWESGTLLNLDLGASELHFNTHARQLRLLQPAGIPVMDGALSVETFRIRNFGLPSVAFIVDASIVSVSVRQLCRAFGWPEFGGRIGGQISKLRMRDNVVTLGGTLHAQVFDGQVEVSDLRLEQPFSKWPRLYASIALDNLDLNLITSAFSFGSITGRLSGAIDGLQLFNWQPVAFDARLYTPRRDRSPHRISQRAIRNIGSIGGGRAGVTAALSRGVMRFFDSFNYDRLGISCRLENDVCHIDGIAPAPNGGYYLVRGRRLPRIDVIGGARRVDWPRLVQQLIAVTRSEGPVVR